MIVLTCFNEVKTERSAKFNLKFCHRFICLNVYSILSLVLVWLSICWKLFTNNNDFPMICFEKLNQELFWILCSCNYFQRVYIISFFMLWNRFCIQVFISHCGVNNALTCYLDVFVYRLELTCAERMCANNYSTFISYNNKFFFFMSTIKLLVTKSLLSIFWLGNQQNNW